MCTSDHADGPVEAGTAFRAAEKRYQLHREQLFRFKNGKRRSKGMTVRPLDLTDVLDPQADTPLPPGVACHGVPSGMPPSAAAFTCAGHPGLLLVRGALDAAVQRQLVVDALTRYPEPPNHTNHTKAHPGGLAGLWAAAQRGLQLQHATTVQQQAAPQPQPPDAGGYHQHAQAAAASGQWGTGGSGPSAVSLLRRLRWATLGPPYDWTRRAYLRDVPHMPLPPLLRELASELAAFEARHAQRGGQQQREPFCPDAALVNYYHEGDTLNGHVDDAERSLAQPLVSLSLGCDAIFLMGGATKDVAPTALLLRSGDALVLAAEARRCYHGVPRVLTDRPLPPALHGGEAGGSDGGAAAEGDPFLPFECHMRCCRINISIRDTR